MTMKKGRAKPSDALIGKRIRELRKARKITQSDLAESCGVTFQQIQKYEAGTNRVTLSTAILVSEAIGVPIVSLLPVKLQDQQQKIVNAMQRELDQQREFMKGVAENIKKQLR